MNTTTNTQSEILYTRTTFDGIRVVLLADGGICDGAGRGVSRCKLSVRAAIVIMGDVCLFTWAELPTVIKAAAKAEREGADVRHAIRQVGAKKAARKVSSRVRREGKPYTLAGWRQHLNICRAIHCRVCG
jgi:hypothetical protein